MATKNPTEVAKKWQRNLAASTDSIRAGVQAVQEAPTEKAARRADAYLAGVQKSVSDGKWQAGLRRITLPMWQTAMLTKGIQRIASGATAAEPKMADFMAEFLPHMDQVVAGVNRDSPRGDIEQNIARAVAVMRGAASFRRSR